MGFWTRSRFDVGALLCRAVGLCLISLSLTSAQAQRAASPPASSSATDRELTVLNHGRSTVNEVYVSPSSADQWGDDKLGDDTLDPGKSFRVKLGRVRDCEFDVQVVYDDGSHEESRRVNVCRTRQLAFDGSTAVAPPQVAQGEEHTLTLVNNAGRPIQQVFISPADAAQWGDDRLADDSISVGDSTKLTYRGDCAADLRVVFDNKAAEERRGLDLCRQATLSIEPGWTTSDAPPAGGGTRPAPPSARPAPDTPSPKQAAPAVPPAPAPAVPTAPAARPTRSTVTLLNQSGHPAVELYLYPIGTTERGSDLLGAGELKDGGTLAVPFDRGTNCKFTAHVVFGGKVPDGEQRDVDLCGSQQVVLRRQP